MKNITTDFDTFRRTGIWKYIIFYCRNAVIVFFSLLHNIFINTTEFNFPKISIRYYIVSYG